MKDRKTRDSRLIRLIAAQSEPDPDQTSKSEDQEEHRPRDSTKMGLPSPTPSSAVGETELRAFVNEELSQQRMAEIETILKREPDAFRRYTSLRLEVINSMGPDTPQALRARAHEAFVGGERQSSSILGLWGKCLDFLDRFLAPGLRIPAAGAVATATVLLAIFLVNGPGVDGARSPIIVANLGLEGGFTFRGSKTANISDRDAGTIELYNEQLADALIKERTVPLSEALVELLRIGGRLLDEGDRERIAEELNRLAGGLDFLESGIDPDSFSTVVISEIMSYIINDDYITGWEIRSVVLNLSPSDLGLSDSNQKGILYIDLFM